MAAVAKVTTPLVGRRLTNAVVVTQRRVGADVTTRSVLVGLWSFTVCAFVLGSRLIIAKLIVLSLVCAMESDFATTDTEYLILKVVGSMPSPLISKKQPGAVRNSWRKYLWKVDMFYKEQKKVKEEEEEEGYLLLFLASHLCL